METPDFFTRVYACFNQHQVEYLISGAFAVNFHGHSRDTGALDLWVNPTKENIHRLVSALASLGYDSQPATYLQMKHGEGVVFLHKHQIVKLIPQLAIPTPFSEALERSIKSSVYGVEIQLISLEDLLNDKMKRATPLDIADVKALIQLKSHKNPLRQ